MLILYPKIYVGMIVSAFILCNAKARRPAHVLKMHRRLHTERKQKKTVHLTPVELTYVRSDAELLAF